MTLSLVMPNPTTAGSEGGATRPGLPQHVTTSSSSTPPSDDTPTNISLGPEQGAALAVSGPLTPAGGSSDEYYQPDLNEPIQLDADNKVAPYVSFASFDEEAWLKLRMAKKDSKGLN